VLTNKEIGLRIKSVRETRGATLQEVADKIGVAKSTVQRYEAGTIDKIKLPIISSIAKVLEVNPSWIIGKSENMDVKDKNENDYELEDVYFSFAKEMQKEKISSEDMDKLWKFYEMIKKK
jgi:transcriptional regulator with XRE-family HTH domain